MLLQQFRRRSRGSPDRPSDEPTVQPVGVVPNRLLDDMDNIHSNARVVRSSYHPLFQRCSCLQCACFTRACNLSLDSLPAMPAYNTRPFRIVCWWPTFRILILRSRPNARAPQSHIHFSDSYDRILGHRAVGRNCLSAALHWRTCLVPSAAIRHFDRNLRHFHCAWGRGLVDFFGLC
jgi:hypothetical protein